MRISSLLVLFAVSTAFAAERMPTCTKRGKNGKVPSLDAVRSCQDRERKKVFDDYQKREKTETPLWLQEKMDDHQRGEIRGFLQKHPEAASFSHEPKSSKESRGKKGKVSSKQASDILSTLTGYFGGAAGKIKKMLGISGKSKSIGTPTSADLEAARSMKLINDAAKESGLDLEKHRAESMINPGGTLGKRVKKYNKSLNKNLDPSMKKYFKGKKKKK